MTIFAVLFFGFLPPTALDEISPSMVFYAATAHGVTCFSVVEHGGRQSKVFLFDHDGGRAFGIEDGRMPLIMARAILPHADGFYLFDSVRRQLFSVDREGGYLEAAFLRDFEGAEGNPSLSNFIQIDSENLAATAQRGGERGIYTINLVERRLAFVSPLPDDDYRKVYFLHNGRYLFLNAITGRLAWLNASFRTEKDLLPWQDPELDPNKRELSDTAKKLGLDNYKVRLQPPLFVGNQAYFTEGTGAGRRCLILDLNTDAISRSHLMPLGSVGDSHLVFNDEDEEIQRHRADSLAALLARKSP